ncbi:MAG: hypothetical protein LBJ24_08460 [Treponema sp.]|jgi:hypothetical protein|nr:hypothetical protein [Treponema sp.]
MNKIIKYSIYMGLAALLAACAGTPESVPPPPWADNPETVFPGGKYIAVRGTSGSRETVNQAALSALSAYFQVQVSNRTDIAELYTEEDGEASQSLRFEQQTLVRTETELFAVRYTDPWQNFAAGTWETIAYIDRNEAWTIFEPRLASGTAPFMEMFRVAENDSEPLRRFFRYRAAWNFDPAALAAYLDFAQALNPGRAAAFSPARGAIAALPRRMDQARFEASFYIDCPVDMDGVVEAALAGVLSAEGFPVTKDRAAAGAVCLASVDEGLERREGGTFYTPALTVNIQGKADPLFSMNIQAPRQSATNPDIARRRAYAALAGEIPAKFRSEFERQMTANNNAN